MSREMSANELLNAVVRFLNGEFPGMADEELSARVYAEISDGAVVYDSPGRVYHPGAGDKPGMVGLAPPLHASIDACLAAAVQPGAAVAFLKEAFAVRDTIGRDATTAQGACARMLYLFMLRRVTVLEQRKAAERFFEAPRKAKPRKVARKAKGRRR